MQRFRPKTVIILVAALFAAPVLLALALRLMEWSPGAGGNHGRLVQPTVRLESAAPAGLDRHWVLVFVPNSPCGAQCGAGQDTLRRVHRALGGDAHRVRLVTVPELSESAGSRPWLAELRGAVPGGLRTNAVYLVDPRGYLMMWYPAGFQAAGMLEDLERLLRYSRVGVQ